MVRKKDVKKTKKGKSRGKKRCVVEDSYVYDFKLSRETPISEEEVEKVENVMGVDNVVSMGRYTIDVDVAPVYDTDAVIKRVKKVLGCV